MRGFVIDILVWSRAQFGVNFWSRASSKHKDGGKWTRVNDKEVDEEILLRLLGNNIPVDISCIFQDHRRLRTDEHLAEGSIMQLVCVDV